MVYDVCIIGTGSAGLSAAYTLALAGVTVVLIKQPKSNNLYIDKGETLNPNIGNLLSSINLKEKFEDLKLLKVSSFKSCWGSSKPVSRSAIFSPIGAGWILNRPVFEDMLFQNNEDLGVKIIEGETKNVNRVKSIYEIQLNKSTSIYSTISSKYIIYATGRKCPTFLNEGSKLSIDKLICCNIKIATNSSKIDTEVRLETVNSGWLYTVQTSSTYRILNFFTDGDLIKTNNKRELLSLISNYLQTSNCISNVISAGKLNNALDIQVFSANTSFRNHSFGEGWFICGDLAQTFDPLSSMGITTAIDNGIYTARLIINHINGHLIAPTLHDAKRKDVFVKYLYNRLLYYKQEVRWQNSVFWDRRQNLDEYKKILKALFGFI